MLIKYLEEIPYLEDSFDFPLSRRESFAASTTKPAKRKGSNGGESDDDDVDDEEQDDYDYSDDSESSDYQEQSDGEYCPATKDGSKKKGGASAKKLDQDASKSTIVQKIDFSGLKPSPTLPS